MALVLYHTLLVPWQALNTLIEKLQTLIIINATTDIAVNLSSISLET